MDADQLLDANLHRVFGERDPDARRRAIDEVYAEDVVFTDPEGSVTGRDALAAKAAELLGGAPADFVFAEDGRRYVADDLAVLGWAFGPAGAPVAHGVDILTIRDGRIAKLRTILA
jgi:ketosteroid isomerase-like protein